MGGGAHAVLVPTVSVPEPTLRQIRELMDAAFAGDFSDDDWAHTIGGVHAVVADAAGAVLAHASVVARTITVGGAAFRAGYVEGVATLPDRQGEGLGSMAMEAIAEHLRGVYQLGVLGTGEWHFYERLGWERWQGMTWVRRAAGLERTEDDDDGIMVLRFGPSAAAELTADIVCEERPGDVW
ncbi:MAG: GNAT family N-acetyltransferase [Ilumatobacter sp.]|uniref:GNAT family N-acetyltransferase n=1 Tax=Ilumatobacter sp. TaxID=1967498 RepID=UPI00261A0CA2|nr:GNAT family N-acetyltransferase [Ilumatobacter sp.]MDJ0768677.1 GNAT family N-acetyltransferase [Ilumatobacter sp.]